jgi:hypothetical protein
MKIRHDAAFLSSLLFTIAFVWIIPWEWALIMTGRHGFIDQLDARFKEVVHHMNDVGRLSLVIILVGLIVVWTGYLKKLRWTWFVMFVIVCGWAFPDLIWHDILHSWAFIYRTHMSDWLGLFADAARGDRVARGMVEEILLFLLMVMALFLPVKSFFFEARKGPIQTRPVESCPTEVKTPSRA